MPSSELVECTDIACPLCLSTQNEITFEETKNFKRTFLSCGECSLVFVHPKHFLAPKIEKSRYEMHENDIRDDGYVSFLNQLIIPMLKLVSKDQHGLDYGCGPYPMMAELINEQGHHMDVYDPFFKDDQSVLKNQYDYLTCCEVVEHFHYPEKEFAKLLSLVKKDGLVGIRTNILYDDINFSGWHYKEDETHVSFYTPSSIEWIERHFGLVKVVEEKNVIIWKKS